VNSFCGIPIEIVPSSGARGDIPQEKRLRDVAIVAISRLQFPIKLKHSGYTGSGLRRLLHRIENSRRNLVCLVDYLQSQECLREDSGFEMRLARRRRTSIESE
jgi:hypothetical protein